MRSFFSSRRRHTRWPRDWSSDVCSSDLLGEAIVELDLVSKKVFDKTLELHQQVCGGELTIGDAADRIHKLVFGRGETNRSEERRVGKECEAGWTAQQCEQEQDHSVERTG